MASKDPHIAMIDAKEQIDRIKLAIRNKIADLQARSDRVTAEDRAEVRRFINRAIDQTRRIQDELADELTSHGLRL